MQKANKLDKPAKTAKPKVAKVVKSLTEVKLEALERAVQKVLTKSELSAPQIRLVLHRVQGTYIH